MKSGQWYKHLLSGAILKINGESLFGKGNLWPAIYPFKSIPGCLISPSDISNGLICLISENGICSFCNQEIRERFLFSSSYIGCGC